MGTLRKRLLQRNIWKLYILSALQGAIFLIPVIVPFYRENGVTIAQLLLLEAIFSIEIVLLEIPTGYLSDRWGRKPTVVTGFAFALMGWFLYSIGTNFWIFLVGEIVMGIGASLLSGTQEAMTYDTLLELQETGQYRKISGHQYSATFFTESITSILGGLIALASLRSTVWITFSGIACAFILSWTLLEPYRHKMQEKEHWKNMWRIFVHTVIHHAPLRSIIALHAILSTLTLSLFWLTQPYQIMIALPMAFFGITHAVVVGAGATASHFAHAVSKRIDDRLFLVLIAVVVIASYAGLGFTGSLWSLSFFLTGRVAWGFLSPLTSDLVNRMTTSDVRATVLSIRALGSRLLFSLSAPLVGYAVDVVSLPQTILMMSGIGTVALLMIFLLMQPIWRRIPA